MYYLLLTLIGQIFFSLSLLYCIFDAKCRIRYLVPRLRSGTHIYIDIVQSTASHTYSSPRTAKTLLIEKHAKTDRMERERRQSLGRSLTYLTLVATGFLPCRAMPCRLSDSSSSLLYIPCSAGQKLSQEYEKEEEEEERVFVL